MSTAAARDLALIYTGAHLTLLLLFAEGLGTSSSKISDLSFSAHLMSEWANKDTYVELLKERGVPVVDAKDLAAEDYARVTFATVWKPKPGFLSQVDPLMAQRMATWVLWGVINWQRRMEQYYEAQRNCHWDLTIELRANRDNAEVAVGVLGLGVMGQATCRQLVSLGYRVSGWSRTSTHHQQQGIQCFAGDEQLETFVRQQDVLVCLLPLTAQTTGIINHRLLSLLPAGSAVINGGRGKHLVEADLLQALNNGQVGFALLDVFDPEPLPPSSPLWKHPSVRITPHVASMTTLEVC
eukprot:gene4821-5068_t